MVALEKYIIHNGTLVDLPQDNAFDLFYEKFGIDVPEDYRQFISKFGSGAICGFFWIYNPAARHTYINLLEQPPRDLDAYREAFDSPDETNKFPLYPKQEGFFPFGRTDNGDVLFWKTRGDPEEWTVVIASAREQVHDDTGLTFERYFETLFKMDLESQVLPDDLLNNGTYFSPPHQMQ